jgi:hypothetical protein
MMVITLVRQNDGEASEGDQGKEADPENVVGHLFGFLYRIAED